MYKMRVWHAACLGYGHCMNLFWHAALFWHGVKLVWSLIRSLACSFLDKLGIGVSLRGFSLFCWYAASFWHGESYSGIWLTAFLESWRYYLVLYKAMLLMILQSCLFPCRVCRKGVGINLVLCTRNKKWIHNKCRCTERQYWYCAPSMRWWYSDEEGDFASSRVKVLNCWKILLQGWQDRIMRGAEETSRTNVRFTWSKLNELSSIVTVKGASLRLTWKIYQVCMQSVVILWYRNLANESFWSELQRTEKIMVRWMCEDSLRNQLSSVDLYQSLGDENVAAVARPDRRRWFEHMKPKENNEWHLQTEIYV